MNTGFARCVAAALAAAVLLTSCGKKEELKEEYTCTLTVSSTFYWGMGAEKFAELVGVKTGGRVKVKVYPGSTLLKGAQLKSAQMVAAGDIDCAYESTINISTVIPEANIFSLPFFVDTFEDLDALENGETGRAIFEALEKKGLKGLAWAENGFRQLTNGTRPVASPEDLKGMRVRVVGSPIFVDTFRALGADPVNMNWGDAVTAFQQGVVDGQENPVGVLLPVQIFQYHKFLYRWNYCADPLVIYWNKRQWDAFPGDIRKAIAEAARESARYEKALCRAGLDGGESLRVLKEEFGVGIEIEDPLEYLESKGMEINAPGAAERAAFRKAVQPVYKKWVPTIGKGLYEKAVADMKK